MPKYALLILTIVCSSLIASVSFASPLSDYSLGKTAVDIMWFPNLHMTDQYVTEIAALNGTDTAYGQQENLAWGVTTGLGGNWAVQYRQFNPKSKYFEDFNLLQRFGLRTQELNVLYRIDHHVSAYAGWHRARYVWEDVINTPTTTEDEDVLQAGLVGTTQVASGTRLYGMVGVGKALVNCEAGVSYEAVEDLEIDLVYRFKRVEKLDNTLGLSPYWDTVTVKGLGLGITYSF